MGNIVGIDLGTTNSVAAFKLAEVEVVSAPENTPPERKLTRSIVALTSNSLVVGEEAYRQLKADAANVIISVKRLMGRSFSDTVVQQQLSRLNYKVTQATQGTENSLSVWLGNREYEPEDISAEILKKVIDNAQKYQIKRGQTSRITEAVITIPAYFNDKQRHATQAAAKRAGLLAHELLPEPTAAAISYGFKPDADDVKTILVYDFGGGTFDSSVITANGNQFIEAGKAGDLWLGGDDIDSQLISFVKEKVAEAEGLDDIDGLIAKMPHYQRVRFQGDLKLAVERAKIDLSNVTVAQIIPATPLLDDLGMAVNIDVVITRKQFEEMILPLVERTIKICQDAIKFSDYPPDMIDLVLLVGGSSQIPLVQQHVKKAFGEERVVVHPRPMYAVAEGAAIVAAGLTEKVSTVSRDYFIELADNQEYQIIRQGDILPVRTSHTFKTQADGQSLIHFKFSSPDKVREEISEVKFNERIGEIWLALDKPYPKGTEIFVTVELDEKNNSLQIMAALKNDPSIKINSSFSRGGVDEEISRRVEQIIAELNQDKLTPYGVEKANKLAGVVVRAANQIKGEDGINRLDRLQMAQENLKELESFASEDRSLTEVYINDFEFVLEYCQTLLLDGQKEEIETLIISQQEALVRHNFAAMQKLIEDAKKERDNLPELVRVILACRHAIFKANIINPTQANAMSIKFSRLLDTIAQDNLHEASQLCEKLLPDVREYIERDLPVSNIVTGLTR